MSDESSIGNVENIDISKVNDLLEVLKNLNDQSKLETIEVLLKKKNEHDELLNFLNQKRSDIDVPEFKEKVAILWLNQTDAEHFADDLFGYIEGTDIPNDKILLPGYLRQQITSRVGRPGNSRLRIPDHIKWPSDFILGENIGTRRDDIFSKPKNPEHVSKHITNNSDYYGGILFEKADLKYLKGTPGIITDIDMNVLENK